MVNKECVDKDISCNKCGSKFTYIRLKTNERICRSCGYIEKLEDKS